MKAVRILIGLLASGLVVAACGGSSDDDDGSGGVSGASASSGGHGGSSGSGSSSLGGASAARGGSGPTAQGGDATQATGGSENAAGSSGELGGSSSRGGATGQARGGSSPVGGAESTAGAAGEPSLDGGAGGASPVDGCPGAAPKAGDACTAQPGQACAYPDDQERCTCGGRIIGNRTWTCTATIECPAEEPSGRCTPVAGGTANNRCDYDGSTQCTCETGGGRTGTWNCIGPIACPAAAPMTGDTCNARAGGTAYNQCNFGATRCTCQATGTLGGGDAWECVTPLECPAMSPKTGEACTVVAGGVVNNTCSYGSSRCTCAAPTRGGAASWTCN